MAHERTDSIREKLACPHCTYSLRGLPGDVVTCPECGNGIDIARLVALRWTGRWFRAPMFALLSLPLAVIVVGFILLGVLLGVAASLGADSVGAGLLIAGPLFIFAVWVAGLALVTRRFGSGEGLWLSILCHAIFAGYFVGAPGFILLVVKVIASFAQGFGYVSLPGAVTAIGFAGLVATAYFGERYVARRCIRRYLRRQTLADTMGA
jgi:hypothetical protein